MTISVDEALDRFQPAMPLGVALSGGADSSALLAGCAQRWPGQVIALHVNHGLQAAAVQFEAACQTLCSSLNVPLRLARVDAGHAPGQSPEDAARIARYTALASLAGDATSEEHIGHIALAQHADDQVETLLLALSRGAGPAGLAAMPPHWERMGLHWHRPLLGVAAADIRDWLRARSISWVEDPTNADPSFTRNRIRADLLPPLEACFPHFRDTFARAAQHSAAASALLDELAEIDVLLVLDLATGAPQIQALQALRTPRQANALRYWLKTRFATTPNTAQLQALINQIAACTTRGHDIDIRVGNGFIRREGPVLRWYNSKL
ncbi:MAG: tRNA lysidine(34) synthetase TilS [Betaproteobacteria bacterium]|nr:tRNA lysidine(34) synthetase TilS [Betaproteobacteria bacterium]